MCEKHIKLFFCVHRREADDTLFVFILTEGSAAFAYDIIQLFRNSMDYIVNLFLRENKHKLVSALIIKGCHKLIVAAVNAVISINEKFKGKDPQQRGNPPRKNLRPYGQAPVFCFRSNG